jgi:asparagine synthase (glutamine-hydrolysing)
MCGILGIYGPSTRTYAKYFLNALTMLNHRGPNHQAKLEIDPHFCILGHTRLSILDPDPLAHQPMVGKHGVLIYNGEIYNHTLLRNTLKAGFEFTTHSDTETLLAGLEQNETNFLSQLEGMFAGAYYQKSDQSLILFRDPVGIKPLYYTLLADSTIIFASEIKAILTLLPDLPRQVNTQTLASYLIYENWGEGQSLFQGIQALSPGQILKVTPSARGQLKIQFDHIETKHIEPTFDPSSREETVKWLQEKLIETVHSHLLSDYPVATYLSGGLDSGTVSLLASQYNKNLHAYCGYFESKNSTFDERPQARILAQKAGISLHEVLIKPSDFQENFRDLIWALEEPRMGMGSFSQFMVAKCLSESHKVVLAGHGGDELFFGYPLHQAVHQIESLCSGQLTQLKNCNSQSILWMASLLLNRLKGNHSLAPTLFNPSYIHKKLCIHSDNTPFVGKPMTLDSLDNYYWNTYLPGLLRIEDSISMHHGVETRVPLCDHTFQKIVRALPHNSKLKQGISKYLFKQAIKDWLPPEVLTAPKKGFPTPLRTWFKNDLKAFVHQSLFKNSLLDEWIPQADLLSLWNSFQNSNMPWPIQEQLAHKIWMIISLKEWMHVYNITK